MNRVLNLQNMIVKARYNPLNPKDGAFINHKNTTFVTLYNSILDTYGIFKVDKDWSDYYWVPPDSYVYPTVQWEEIWKEMDYCSKGYYRDYIYSETINGPEIYFNNYFG